MNHGQPRPGTNDSPNHATAGSAAHAAPAPNDSPIAGGELVRQPGWALHPSGQVRPLGKIRSPVTVILLSIVTFGIYSIIWQYKTIQDLYRWRQDGVHGGVSLLLMFFVSLAMPFLMSGYTGSMYEEEGMEKPFGAMHALWLFLPLIGAFIWFFQLQGRINAFWDAKGQLYE